jgi:hypothetical protein
MANIMICEGAHGTTKSRADEIQENGFKLGSGRAGNGVYFWHKSRYYSILAKGWHKQCFYKHKYDKDFDKNCVIIFAQLEADENSVLDMESPYLKDRISELAEAQKVSFTDNNKISKLYDAFIKIMEAELQTTFKFVLIRVAPPERACCPDYPLNIIGAPLCCVVRDNTCITITKCQ